MNVTVYFVVSLLDRRHESEELLNMNDVDVIDLQADGSAVNLNGKQNQAPESVRHLDHCINGKCFHDNLLNGVPVNFAC